MSVWDHPEVVAVFRCQGCGACCRGAEAGIALTAGEAAAIAAHLGCTAEEFAARYCLRQEGSLRLRRSAEGWCSLRTEAGCLAWGLKPRTCSVWPFPARLLEDEEAASAVRASCPGLAPGSSREALGRALRLVHAAYPPRPSVPKE